MTQLDMYGSWQLFKKAFLKRGYTVSEEILDDRLIVRFTSPSGKVWLTSTPQLSYPLFNGTVRKISAHKELAYEFAAHHNISIPQTIVIKDGQVPELSGIDQSKRVIVKPADSSASYGLTLNISTQEALTVAIDEARKYSDKVIVQEQVTGQEVRFAVVGGHVVAALLRQKPQLVGDGVSTVAELLKQENIARKSLVFPYISYPQLDADLIDKSFMVDGRIPVKGEVVELGRSTMIRGGASIYDVMAEIDQSYVKVVEKFVAALGAGFLVVDMIIEDHRRPMKDGNYWFLELNASPSLKLFYGCRDGKMFDIVPILVDAIDKRIHV